MTDDPILPIFRKINAISDIVSDLPSVGKRSELAQRVHEIFVLLDEAREAASDMQKEIISLKYEHPTDRFKRVKGVKRG